MEEQNQLPELQPEQTPVTTESAHEHQHDCCCKSSKWDKLFKAMSIISFVGFIVLLALHFSGKSSSKAGVTSANVPGTSYSIAYINSDSLMNNYDLYDDLQEQVGARKLQMEQDMAAKANKFEQDVNDFQKKVQSYAITSDQAQKMEADLMKRQQQLLDLKENLTNELLELEYTNQSALFDSIIGALKIYNEDHNYDYILGYSKGSGILLANEKYDITPVIIDILNKNYKENK